MKILFVATQYIEKGKPATGFPNYLHKVSVSLLSMGHVPMIIAGGRRNEHRVEEGIEIWTVKTVSSLDRVFSNENLAHLKMSYILNREIRKILKKHPVDIIQFTSIGGIALFYHEKTPAVMRLSSYAKTYFASLQTYDARTLFFKAALERLSARRCDAVYAPCRNTAVAFGKDCKRQIKVIETPFVNDVKRMDYQYVEKYLKGRKYVLFFGTLYPEKGLLVITEILESFLEENPEYYFVFVGEVRNINGVDARKIIREAAGNYSKRVMIWSALSHEKLYPIIEKSDFVVLPSLMDNLPNTCMEAMYFSKIVIGTDGASFEQLIIPGENGLLCEIGNSQDLLEKMQKVVLLDYETKQHMEKNARNTIRRLYPQYTVKKLLHFYDCILEKKKRC